MRPAWAAIAVVVAAVILLEPRFIHRNDGRDALLRGTPEVATRPISARVRNLPAGETEVSWQAFPETERYEVVFYTEDLAEGPHLAAVTDTFIVIPREAVEILPGGNTGAPPAAAYCRILGLRGDKVLSRSPLLRLGQPR